MRITFLLFLIISLTFNLFSQNERCIGCTIDSAYAYKKIHDESNAIKHFKIAYEIDSTNIDANWNLAYYYALIGRRLSDGCASQTVYFDLSRRMANDAYKIDPNNSKSNYAMALAMGIVALIAGPTEKIAASKDIRTYCERSIEIDATYAKSWYILGRWHHAITDLNFIEILAADLLFGGAPTGASMDEAIKCLELSVKYEPQSILYHYSLAAAYEYIDNDTKAIEILKKALKLPVIEVDSEYNRNLCIELMNDLR